MSGLVTSLRTAPCVCKPRSTLNRNKQHSQPGPSILEYIYVIHFSCLYVWEILLTQNKSPLRDGKRKFLNFFLHRGKKMRTVKNFQEWIAFSFFGHLAKNHSSGGGAYSAQGCQNCLCYILVILGLLII